MTNTIANNSGYKNVRRAGRRLVWKAFFFTLPFWMVIGLYLHDDPFKVIHRYALYDSDVTLNEHHVGWSIYCGRRDSLPFNSFILGNSCTMAFACEEWEKHLERDARAVRLFGNGEGMNAILLKLQALERDKAEIRNVLMILDHASLAKTRQSSGLGHLLPAEISGRSPLSVQLEFLQGFMIPDFLFPYLRYKLTGTILPSMKHLNPYGRVRNSANNDAINPRERMIEREGEAYWTNRQEEFPVRNGNAVVAERSVFQSQLALLTDIARLLNRHHCRVRILISPDYNQKMLHPKDKEILCKLFGEANVFDFTGINEYTNDYHYYYEQGHYRPLLGKKLMERIYGGPF